MDKKTIQASLQDELEKEIPSADVHLWQAVKANLVAGKTFQQGEKMKPIDSRRIPRAAFAGLILVALLSLAFVTPQGRALAQTVLQFFTRAESNTFELPTSQLPVLDPAQETSTALPPAPLLTITKAEAQAGFDAAQLPTVPEGFNYLGARIYGNAISIEYGAQGGGGHLIIMQSRDGFVQSEWDKVPGESILPVKIGGLDGEFVRGAFVVYPGDTSTTWNSDAPILRLRWMQDGIWFDMTKFGDVEVIAYLDQTGLIKLAESITFDPFPLDVENVEMQAGSDVLVPATLPQGMTFLGSSFDPALKIISLSFGYSESDRRILIKQGPVGANEACDLCGIVGASASVETVQIGDVAGEYAEGVWELTDNGPVWRDDPYLKTLRWQKDGMAFELIYMGTELEKEALVAIAASMK